MSEEFECSECEKTFDTKRGLHVHGSQVHDNGGVTESSDESKEEDTDNNQDGVKMGLPTDSPWKLATGIMVVLFVVSLAFNIYSFGGGLFEAGGISSEDSSAAREAGLEAADLMEDMFKMQGMQVDTSLVNASDTGSGVYEINIEMSAQGMTETQTSYMTKDEKFLLQQAEEINMGEGATAEEIGEKGAEVTSQMPQMQQGNISVELNRTLEPVSDLHHFELVLSGEVQGEEVNQPLESYATKDGKYFFMQGINVTETKMRIEQMEQLQGSMETSSSGTETGNVTVSQQ